MSFNDYQKLALRTESSDFRAIGLRITNQLDSSTTAATDGNEPRNLRLLHGAIGLCTEAGEVQDQLKRHIFYGAPLDLANLREEIGDVLWYAALLAAAAGTTLSEVAEANIRKLKARYPAKFDGEKAVKRDLVAEADAISGPRSDP